MVVYADGYDNLFSFVLLTRSVYNASFHLTAPRHSLLTAESRGIYYSDYYEDFEGFKIPGKYWQGFYTLQDFRNVRGFGDF